MKKKVDYKKIINIVMIILSVIGVLFLLGLLNKQNENMGDMQRRINERDAKISLLERNIVNNEFKIKRLEDSVNFLIPIIDSLYVVNDNLKKSKDNVPSRFKDKTLIELQAVFDEKYGVSISDKQVRLDSSISVKVLIDLDIGKINSIRASNLESIVNAQKNVIDYKDSIIDRKDAIITDLSYINENLQRNNDDLNYMVTEFERLYKREKRLKWIFAATGVVLVIVTNI